MTEESKANKKNKILFLEDEEILAKLYSKKLKDAGFQVRVYESVKHLFDGMKKFIPDIAFLDYALKGDEKSGLDVIPFLKESNPKMAIIMLSNYCEFQMEEAVKKAGAHDYLLKIDTPPEALAEYASKLAR